MILPEYFMVLGKKVPIVLKPQVYCDDTGKPVDGKTDGDTIWISETVRKSKRIGTALHELWHCYERRSGLWFRKEHDEEIEEVHAEGFQNIVTENFILRSRWV